MENQLREGTWKNGKPKTILITYPKRREALSVSFKDRIYQRSINDNVLYPAMAKTFIKENCACQHGKVRTMLERFLKSKYGDITETTDWRVMSFSSILAVIISI